jgi:ABC-type glycerol-3-phosphate transport system substrate-binding protein
MEKRRAVVGALLVLLLVLDAVAGVGIAAAKDKLTVWTYDQNTLVVNVMKPEFEKRYPNVEVEVVKMGPWDLMDKLLVSLASGSGLPDVSVVIRRAFTKYAASGKLLDLTDLAKSYAKDFDPAIWSEAAYQGRQYGMPDGSYVGLVWYRDDILRNHGIDPSKIVTWDDFIQVGQRLKKEGLQTGMAWSSFWAAGGFWLMHLQSMGGNLFTADGKVIRNNEIARKAFRAYDDLVHKHGIALMGPVNTPAQWIALREGRLAASQQITGSIPMLKAQNPELAGKMRVMPFPLWSKDAPPLVGTSGGNVWAIPKGTRNQEMAWKFVELLNATVEGQRLLWQHGNLVPAFKPALESPVVNQPDPYFGGQNVYRVAIAPRRVSQIYYYDLLEAQKLVGEELDAMLQGRKPPEQAWNDAEAKLIKELGR